MAQIKVIPLGAGQDVGRSCVLVSLGGKNIMFDCGMHMGFNDERRFPDFSYISRTGKFTEAIDCVIISHFHLDHCGALPYFTEICGYDGPVYMTHPTKAIVPILLEDYRKITTERKGETNFFTSENVKDCMKKVRSVNLNETIQVDEDLEIRAYYAGHVLGAAMFYVKSAGLSVIYTGDYNMTPDRHLGAATIDSKIRPTLLITETTYATTIRGSKRMREGNFLKKVHSTVSQGGKVLIPVFAIGRAQELCILLETYWERMGLNVPVYFSPGMTEKANMYYELFILWTNQKIKDTFVKQNMFEFKHIQPFVNSALDRPGPMVLLATPGMLHAGTSLEAFKKWCGSDKNTCILPGFCVNGTVGRKVLDGQKNIEIDKNTKLTVRCAIESLSFSAHADSKGILQLIQQCEPQNVLLVHGEAQNMLILKDKIFSDFKIPVYTPANGEIVYVNANLPIKADLSTILLKRQFYNNKNSPFFSSADDEEGELKKKKYLHQDVPVNGYMIVHNKTAHIKVVDPSEVSLELGLTPHKIQFSSSFIITDSMVKNGTTEVIFKSIMDTLKAKFNENPIRIKDSINCNSLFVSLNIPQIKEGSNNDNNSNDLSFSWNSSDDAIVESLLELLTTTFQLKPLLLDLKPNNNISPIISQLPSSSTTTKKASSSTISLKIATPSSVKVASSPLPSIKLVPSPVPVKKELKTEDPNNIYQNLSKEQIYEKMKSSEYSNMLQEQQRHMYSQYPQSYSEHDYHQYQSQAYLPYPQYPSYPQQYIQPRPMHAYPQQQQIPHAQQQIPHTQQHSQQPPLQKAKPQQQQQQQVSVQQQQQPKSQQQTPVKQPINTQQTSAQPQQNSAHPSVHSAARDPSSGETQTK